MLCISLSVCPSIYSHPRTLFWDVGRNEDYPRNQLSFSSGWMIFQCPVVESILLLCETQPLQENKKKGSFNFEILLQTVAFGVLENDICVRQWAGLVQRQILECQIHGNTHCSSNFSKTVGNILIDIGQDIFPYNQSKD